MIVFDSERISDARIRVKPMNGDTKNAPKEKRFSVLYGVSLRGRAAGGTTGAFGRLAA